jgi:hypothetical protein
LNLANCLLKLNQAHVVQAYIVGLQNIVERDYDYRKMERLNEIKVESALRLRNWQALDDLVNEVFVYDACILLKYVNCSSKQPEQGAIQLTCNSRQVMCY